MLAEILKSVRERGQTADGKKNSLGGAAPGTRICFNPTLLDELQEEHMEVLELLARMEVFLRKKRLSALEALLEELGEALRMHRLKEDVSLMIYLERKYREDPQRFQAIRKFRQLKEAKLKQVQAFLSRYSAIASHPVLLERFGADLRTVGWLMVRQIEQEEREIYPLYCEEELDALPQPC